MLSTPHKKKTELRIVFLAFPQNLTAPCYGDLTEGCRLNSNIYFARYTDVPDVLSVLDLLASISFDDDVKCLQESDFL